MGYYISIGGTSPSPTNHKPQIMETTVTTTTLGQQAVDWWCPPDRDTTGLAEIVDAQLAKAKAAMAQKDWSDYHCLLNRVAISELGYDDEDQEEELLGYLDDLCRGYL